MLKTAIVTGPVHFSARQSWRSSALLIWLGLVLAGAGATWITAATPVRETVVLLCLVQGGIGLLFWKIELETVLTPTGVYARLRPFHRRYRHWPWAELTHAYLRPYRALTEYGGWGLRWGGPRRGAAWILGGNQGLQLVSTTGRRWLLGTVKPAKLAAALHALGQERPPATTNADHPPANLVPTAEG